MKIAKIVSSNSHIDYVARVLDARDEGAPPKAADHSFGQFVSVAGEDERVIGVIYDSRLVNPEYGSFGPKLAPRAAHVNPDFVREQGVLLGILLLGVISSDGRAVQGVPPRIVPPGQDVIKIDADIVRKFHNGSDGSVHLHYYAQVVANAGQFAIPLLDSIIKQLSETCSEAEVQRLEVLRQSLTWQGTFGGIKL